MNYMQVKELRPALASMSPFTWLPVPSLDFLQCKTSASRLEKGLIEARAGINSLTLIKFITFCFKNTKTTCLNNEVITMWAREKCQNLQMLPSVVA